jgi:hypothetical protein
MADWIARVVARRAPNALRSADPFHVVAWAIEALDIERRRAPTLSTHVDFRLQRELFLRPVGTFGPTRSGPDRRSIGHVDGEEVVIQRTAPRARHGTPWM